MTRDEERAERGRFSKEFFAMVSEGLPPDDLIRKIVDWAEHDTPDRYLFLSEQLKVVYANVVEGSEIPDDVVGADRLYGEMRASDRIVRSTIEQLMSEIRRRLEK